MLHIIKKQINMSYELHSKIKWACRINSIKQQPEIITGCLRIIEHTNLAYVEPHRVIINNKLCYIGLFVFFKRIIEIVNNKYKTLKC